MITLTFERIHHCYYPRSFMFPPTKPNGRVGDLPIADTQTIVCSAEVFTWWILGSPTVGHAMNINL